MRLPHDGLRLAAWRDPIGACDVDDELRRLGHQLEALDNLIAADRALWTAGPSARSLLPGATLLADPLSR
jgi:hypothetical protein